MYICLITQQRVLSAANKYFIYPRNHSPLITINCIKIDADSYEIWTVSRDFITDADKNRIQSQTKHWYDKTCTPFVEMHTNTKNNEKFEFPIICKCFCYTLQCRTSSNMLSVNRCISRLYQCILKIK